MNVSTLVRGVELAFDNFLTVMLSSLEALCSTDSMVWFVLKASSIRDSFLLNPFGSG